MAEHTVLVTAAGGNIGLELIPQLLSTRRVKLVVATRNAARTRSSLPSAATPDTVVIEEGSIRDPNWVQSIITTHAVDTVFLCVSATDELLTTLNFLDAMERAGPCVKHLVYVSSHGDHTSPESVATISKRCGVSHVLVKLTIEQKLAHANLPWTTTTLGPTLFFTEDLVSKSSMLDHGVFDQALGEIGVARASPSDIALAATNVIIDPMNPGVGHKIPIGSLRRFTASEATAIWSKALDRPLRAVTAGAALETAQTNHFGSHSDDAKAWGRSMRIMYEEFERFGFGMSEEEYRFQVQVLGKEPEDYETWVRKTAASWRV